MRVRRYEARDADACRLLWTELTEWHRRIYDRPSIGGEDPAAAFDDHAADAELWVAEEHGRVVGLAGLLLDGDRGEIEPVVVAEAARGAGVGRALVEAVVAACRTRGLRQLRVRPVARNAAAVAFFHGLGFDVIGRVDLLVDLVPRDEGPWADGERLAGRDFRV